MSFALLRQAMLHVENALRPIVQTENVQLHEAERTISWRNRRSGILRGTYYPLEYQTLLDAQQYSFLMRDGSFLQFFYSCGPDDAVSSARLAFYPSPMGSQDSAAALLAAGEEALEREDEQLFEHLYNWAELMEVSRTAPSNTSHIRFDYDPGAHAAHAPSHIQYGAINNLRLGANFFPMPMAFIEMLLPMLAGVDLPLELAHLNFARNNVISLPDISELISLSHLRR